MIYDPNREHYMYPNEARLRNMTYGITIHYDVDVEFIFLNNDGTDGSEQKSKSSKSNGKAPLAPRRPDSKLSSRRGS